MAGSVNRVILIGNLGRDPEMRSLNDGARIANITVATSETWKDRNSGERKERSEFHRVVIFNERLAEVAEKYLKKGSKVYLEGALTTRKWTDQNNQERHTTEIVLNRFRGELVMLGGSRAAQGGAYSDEDGSGPYDTPRSRDTTPPHGAAPPGSRRDVAERAGERMPVIDLDSDIPF